MRRREFIERGIFAKSAPTRLGELFNYPCFCHGGCQIIRE